ncbi:flavin reductase family protein [Actinokineospora sp. 24-640]
MTVDQAPTQVAVFTDAMARLAAGLAVVTTADAGGAPRGLLVSSLCSYSADPPSVLFTVGRAAGSYRALTGGGEFGVHLLAAGQAPLATRFARSGGDKFAGVRWGWDGRVPRLADAAVYLRCAAERVFPHGDHAVVIGAVVAIAASAEDGPLVYYGRRYDWRLAAPV